MEIRKIKAMTSAEIADTSKRVQMWLVVIVKNESIQRLGDAEEVMHFVEREKNDRGFISNLDLMCIRHAIEVCPVKCNLTKKNITNYGSNANQNHRARRVIVD